MWRPIVVQTPPAAEPVSASDAKAHLRVDGTAEDALIASLIQAARAHVESVTGQRLMAQTLILKAEEWGDLAHLPVAPISAVASIGYVDTDGEAQTLDAEDYAPRLEGLDPVIEPAHGVIWPQRQPGSQITVTVTAGYANAAAIPPELVHAIKLMVGDLYAFRETAGTGGERIAMTPTVGALLANHRRWL